MKRIKVEEARWLVDEFGLDIDKSQKVDKILEELIEEGISFETMEDALSRRGVAQEEPSFTKKDPVVLIKMQRQNPTFRFRKYKFTKDHPFVLMNEDDATAILTLERGFSRATVSEAEAHYGKG